MDRLGWFRERFRLIDDAERRRRAGPGVVTPEPAAPVPDAGSPDAEQNAISGSAVPGSGPAGASSETLATDGDAHRDEPRQDADPGGSGSDENRSGTEGDSLGDEGDGLIRPDKLDDAIKWAAAGFTALAAVLAFLGYQEGVLDQALRIYPAASIAVLVLLGTGVVGALLARAVDPQARFLLWSLLALLLLMLFSASLFLPDIGDISRGDPLIAEEPGFDWTQLYKPVGLALVLVFLIAAVITVALWDTRSTRAAWVAALGAAAAVMAAWLLAPRTIDPLTGDAGGFDTTRLAGYALSFAVLAGLLLLTVLAFARGTTFSLMAGLTILAVASTALGLYGATKVAVEAKSLRSLPQVEADIENKDGTSTVTIAVTGSRVRGLRVVVGVNGLRRSGMPRTMDDPTEPADAGGTVIWSGLIRPGALDEIDRTVRVDVHPERWDRLDVYFCLATDEDGTFECDPSDAASVASFTTPAPARDIAEMTATLAEQPTGKVKATFSASDLAPGVLTRLELCRERAKKHTTHVLDVTLGPGPTGDLDWETTVGAGRKGDKLLLRHTTCSPGEQCTAKWRTLSTFVNEGSAQEPVAPASSSG